MTPIETKPVEAGLFAGTIGVACDTGKAALAWATACFPVFPCGANKAPLTPRGFHDATTDAGIVQAWWAMYPGALIGVPTGPVSGLLALDLDVKRGVDGIAAFELVRGNRILPRCPVVRTRSSGLHLFFRHPGERAVKNSAGRIGPGIDVRAGGGYVIVPPSLGYEVAADGVPPPAPGWLLDLMVPPAPTACAPKRTRPGPEAGRHARRALAGILRTAARAAEGGRNAATFWAGCRAGELVAAGLLTEAAAVAAVAEAAVASGLSAREARQAAANGVTRGLAGGGAHAA